MQFSVKFAYAVQTSKLQVDPSFSKFKVLHFQILWSAIIGYSYFSSTGLADLNLVYDTANIILTQYYWREIDFMSKKLKSCLDIVVSMLATIRQWSHNSLELDKELLVSLSVESSRFDLEILNYRHLVTKLEENKFMQIRAGKSPSESSGL